MYLFIYLFTLFIYLFIYLPSITILVTYTNSNGSSSHFINGILVREKKINLYTLDLL